jgi:hypothetical protein
MIDCCFTRIALPSQTANSFNAYLGVMSVVWTNEILRVNSPKKFIYLSKSDKSIVIGLGFSNQVVLIVY